MIRRYVRESLVLDIYIIGYKKQGESIVFVISVDNKVSYTCIVDCYEYNQINKTIEILDEIGIGVVDMICWTHPDLDHSIGIDKLLGNYTNEKTKVLIPEGLDGDRESYNYDIRVKRTFDKINSSIKSNKMTAFHAMSVSDSKNLYFEQYEYTKDSLLYEFEVKSVAPSSYLIRRRGLYKSMPKKNDYSMAFYIRLGELQLFLGGDIENKSIELMEGFYMPKTFHLIKTPHHTSLSSNDLLKILDKSSKSDIICSTVYRSSNLPDKELIEEYKEYAKDFFCTGSVIAEKDIDDYGYIHVCYDIINSKSITYLHGNANAVFSQSV